MHNDLFDMESLGTIYKKGTVRKLKKWLGYEPSDPYMKFKEIDFFTELLINFKPKKCLEYGGGLSTPFFLKYLPEDTHWFSIENNAKWFDIIKDKIKSDRIHLSLVDVAENIDQDAETDSYVCHAETLGGQFDFILVDGINRENCIDMAAKYLKKGGLLVVHDANRVQYHEHIKQFKNWRIIQDFRKTAGGFALASNDLDLDHLVDWKRHSRLWKADSAVSNFFKFKFIMGRKKSFKLEQS